MSALEMRVDVHLPVDPVAAVAVVAFCEPEPRLDVRLIELDNPVEHDVVQWSMTPLTPR